MNETPEIKSSSTTETARMLGFTREEVDGLLGSPEYTPDKLIAIFEKNFAAAYAADAGVSEGYSIRRHTLMVLEQFDKYLGNKEISANIDNNLMRVVLALHDIGKPDAIKNGSKNLQHQYTTKIIEPVLRELKYEEHQIKIALALVGADPIGEYLQQKIDLNAASKKIGEMARAAQLPIDEFYKILLAYFKSDVASYTKDAGGIESLDYLFKFDRENRVLNFSDTVENQIQTLRQNLLSI